MEPFDVPVPICYRDELPSATADMNPSYKCKKAPVWSPFMYRRADLNCRPSGYESDALTS